MPHEFEIMKTHTTLGHDAIENAERQLGITVEFLACAKEIALNHQEKWDGSGYPRQLAGNAIPISARLMAVADVYDALTTHRVYKDAMPHDEAIAIILEGRGSHFDPDIVDAFAVITEQFRGSRTVTRIETGSPPARVAPADLSFAALTPSPHR